MNRDQKELLKLLFEYNQKNKEMYNVQKASEELQELSLELTKLSTKPVLNEERVQAIIDEIGDVEIRFRIMKMQFDKKAIKARVKLKLAKFAELLLTKEYETI